MPQRRPERDAAIAAGEAHYFTGIPCKNGHIAKRYVANNGCMACASLATLRSQAKAPEHPNRIAARGVGLLHYSTGEPCIHGHDKRFVSTGQCVQCSLDKAKRWNQRNPGHMAAGARRRRAKDPTGHRAEVKRWADKNRAAKRAADRAWREANREYWRSYMAVYAQNRRARKAKNGGFYTTDDVAALRAKQGGRCAACKTSEGRLEVDHIVPVARGGSNDQANLQLLCSWCNKSKGARDMAEWAADHGFEISTFSCDA
jgi:5-methylcytosine-specific restriction endonuclease McrA